MSVATESWGLGEDMNKSVLSVSTLAGGADGDCVTLLTTVLSGPPPTTHGGQGHLQGAGTPIWWYGPQSNIITISLMTHQREASPTLPSLSCLGVATLTSGQRPRLSPAVSSFRSHPLDKQPALTVAHRELYSASCNKG